MVQRLVSGTTTYSLTQASYDALGRARCTAQRMNTAEFAAASLPADACTPDTEGTYGPDRITRLSYDDAGRTVKLEVGVGVTGTQADEVAATYTANGQTDTLTDGEGNSTSFVYDGFDRPTQMRYPSTAQGAGTSSTTDYEALSYDEAGNVTNQRLRDNTDIGYTYDALNRVTTKDLPGSQLDVNFGYDLLGQMTGASTTAQQLTFTYDALGRQLSEEGPLGTVSRGYDAGGRRISLSGPTFYAAYDYLTTGELRTIYTDGPSITYGYDSLGRRTTMDRANGTAMGWTYDAAGRLSGMTDDAAGTAYDRAVTFTYNPAGQIVSRTEANDTYAFTALANQNVTDTHNGLNQVTATGSTAVTHDARGNTNAIGSTSYTYDSQNRLTSGPGATLSYDPLGRLYQVTTSTGARRYVYDGLQAMIVQDVPNSGPGSVDYVVSGGNLNEPLLSYTSAGRVYHHADERGSIVAQSGDSGAVTSVNRYDEYGQPQGGSVSGRFAYTGQMWLPELGMYDYHARVYNPGLSRFMQADPIGYASGMNTHAYVLGDPINSFDPVGLSPECARVKIGGYSYDTVEPDGTINTVVAVVLGDICYDPDGVDLFAPYRRRGTWTYPLPYQCPLNRDFGACIASQFARMPRPRPAPQAPDCRTQPLPPASRTYPVPPGYESFGNDRGIYIQRIGDPNAGVIENPAFRSAWNEATRNGVVNHAGVQRDLINIATDVLRDQVVGRGLSALLGRGPGEAVNNSVGVAAAANDAGRSLYGNECSW